MLCVVCYMLYTRINNDYYIFNNMDHAIEAMYEGFVKKPQPRLSTMSTPCRLRHYDEL